MQQLDLFGAQRLPKKPWCTDDKEAGLQVKPLARALAKRYLQFNPPHAVFWIVLDVDAPIALADTEKPSEQMLAILDGQIPTPNFMVVNRENGHAHAFYALETAVAKGEHASQKALRYVAAIEAALIRTMGSDACYSGLVAKNPHHNHWRLVEFRHEAYTLAELHEGLDLKGPSKSRLRREAIGQGLGRNCDLFDRLRYHAYKMVEMYREDANEALWQRYIQGKAEDYNDFPQPLDAKEVRHVAKSVARWTWMHYNGQMSDAAFSKRQAVRGARGGRISAKARESAAGGRESFREQMAQLSSKGISVNRPWEAEGISRAQWYRTRKIAHEKLSHH